MIDSQNRDHKIREASDRSAEIREAREQVLSRRPPLPIVSSQPAFENGRMFTRYQIDGSREFGRGYRYWLPPLTNATNKSAA